MSVKFDYYRIIEDIANELESNNLFDCSVLEISKRSGTITCRMRLRDKKKVFQIDGVESITEI